MGPPLGHVRDPGKQHRFVEAELTALLQAAGGTLPVIKKDERGVYVMVETAAEHGHAAKTAAPKTAAPAAPAKAPAAAQPTAKPIATPAASAGPKGEAKPDRTLLRRYTYSGVVDSGPIPGESFAQKVERLRAVSAAAKRRAEEGGDTGHAPSPAAVEPESVAESPVTTAVVSEDSPVVAPPAPAPQTASGHASSGPDRTLMRRSTYVGVVDTGPIPGETFQQKVERLRAVAAAAKQRAEGG